MRKLGIKYEDFFEVMNEMFSKHIQELKNERLNNLEYFTMFKPYFDVIVEERSMKRKVRYNAVFSNITGNMGEEISDTYKISEYVRNYVLSKDDNILKSILKKSINFNSDERANEAFDMIEEGFSELNKFLK